MERFEKVTIVVKLRAEHFLDGFGLQENTTIVDNLSHKASEVAGRSVQTGATSVDLSGDIARNVDTRDERTIYFSQSDPYQVIKEVFVA